MQSFPKEMHWRTFKRLRAMHDPKALKCMAVHDDQARQVSGVAGHD